jgi:hypothetical protein
MAMPFLATHKVQNKAFKELPIHKRLGYRSQEGGYMQLSFARDLGGGGGGDEGLKS